MAPVFMVGSWLCVDRPFCEFLEEALAPCQHDAPCDSVAHGLLVVAGDAACG